jgi:hypothetical protein
LAEAVSLAGFQTGLAVKITKKVKIDLEFDTYAGTLCLKYAICWVASEPLPSGLGDVLVSHLVMEKLGYSAVDLLGKAWERGAEFDMTSNEASPSRVVALLKKLDEYPIPQMAPEEYLGLLDW